VPVDPSQAQLDIPEGGGEPALFLLRVLPAISECVTKGK